MILIFPSGFNADVKSEFNLVKNYFVGKADGGFVVLTLAKTSVSYQ